MKDTLSTLDLHEKPGQRITVFTKVRHGLEDQRVDVQPGEQVFSPGPHHGYYGYVHAKEETMPPFTMLPQTAELSIPLSAVERAEGMTKHRLLDLAKQATADRGLNYGKPEDNFERIALRWRAHLKNRFGLEVALDATSVAVMCADLKIARLENQPDHKDSWVDLAGYAACGAEIALKL